MGRTKKWAAGVIFIFSVVLFSISLYFLMGMFAEQKQEADLHDELKAIYQDDGDAVNDDDAATESNDDTEGMAVSAGLLALHEANPDCIGWISIEGTVIDYPVMYRPEEENYYLHRDFYGSYASAGSLFVSELCDPEGSDNLIIYGHHMKNGSMFAALTNYKDKDFYEEHAEIVFDTLHGTEYYQIFAVFRTPVYTANDFAYYSFTGAEDEEDFNAFLSEVAERSLYDTGVEAAYGDKLLTLSTCEYSQKNGRMVVMAKQISEN